jgi:hypothetical protein
VGLDRRRYRVGWSVRYRNQAIRKEETMAKKSNAKKTKKTAPKYQSKDGSPFFAARIPSKVLRAFQAHAKKKKTKPAALVVAFMARTAGVTL